MISPITGVNMTSHSAKFEASGPCISTIELFIFLSCGWNQFDIFFLAERSAQFRQGNVL